MAQIPDVRSFPQRRQIDLGGVPNPTRVSGSVTAGAQIAARGQEQQGQNLQNAGASLQEASDAIFRVQERQAKLRDAADRLNIEMDYATAAEERYRLMNAEGDWSDPKQVDRFVADEKQFASQAFSSHEGRPESRVELQARIGSVLTNKIDQANKSYFDAGAAKELEVTTRALNVSLARVAANPGALDREVNAWADTVRSTYRFTPETDVDSRIRTGTEVIVGRALSTVLDMPGGVDQVQMLLQRPDLVSIIGDQTRAVLMERVRQIHNRENDIAVQRRMLREKAQYDMEATQAKIRGDLAVESLRGKNAIALEQEKAKLGDGKSPLGEGTLGRELAMFADMSTAFGAGLTTGRDDNFYLAAVVDYTQPSVRPNKETGEPEYYRNKPPPYVLDALRNRGYDWTEDDGLIGHGGEALSPPIPTEQPPAQPSAEAKVGENEVPLPEDDPSKYLSQGGMTFAEMAAHGVLTGPAATVKRTLAEIPGAPWPFPDEVAVRKSLDTLVTRLVNAIRVNDRYLEGERKDIIQRIQLETGFWDNSQNFISKLVGLDEALAQIIKDQQEVLDAPGASRTSSSWASATETLRAAEQFRRIMLPPRVADDDAAAALYPSLPEGATLMWRDKKTDRWVIGRKKAKKKESE